MDILEQNLDAKQEEIIRKRLQTSPLNKFLPTHLTVDFQNSKGEVIEHLEVKLEEFLKFGDSLG